MEIWKEIEDYQGLYQVSNLGNVKSLERKCINGKSGSIRTVPELVLKQSKNDNGYLVITLHKNGKRKRFYIHRLVASAFIPNPNNLSEVNHKDEDKTNNTVDNLEWCDRTYNNNYGTRNKRCSDKQNNHIKMSKPVLCVETGIIYQSVHEIQRQLGFYVSYISACCLDKHKQAYGYTWQYIDQL